MSSDSLSNPLLSWRRLPALWSATILSAGGYWVLWVALLAWAYRINESAREAGTLLLGLMLPALLLRPLAGSLVNSRNGQPVAVVAQLVRAAALIPILRATSNTELSTVMAAGWLAMAPSVFVQASQSSLLAAMAGRPPLPTAESLFSNGKLAAMGLGAAMGTVIFARAGLQGCAVVAAGALLLSAALLILARPAPRAYGAPPERPDFAASLSDHREGFLYLLRQPGLRPVAATALGAAFALGGIAAVEVAFTVWGVFVTSENVGILIGFQGAGMGIAAAAYPLLRDRVRTSALMAAALATLALAEFGFALSGNLPWAAFFNTVVGSGKGLLLLAVASAVAAEVEPKRERRVAVSLATASEAVAIPSVVAAGRFADAMTPRFALVLAAILLMVLALYAFGALVDRETAEGETVRPGLEPAVPFQPTVA